MHMSTSCQATYDTDKRLQSDVKLAILCILRKQLVGTWVTGNGFAIKASQCVQEADERTFLFRGVQAVQHPFYYIFRLRLDVHHMTDSS